MKHVMITLLASLACWWDVHGQVAVKTLDECIREALERNLTVQSGKIAVERARELQGTAFNIGRTSLSLTQDPTSGGSPDNSLVVGQSFDFPTLYATRHALLKAETDVERGKLEVTRNELAREVSAIYYQLLHARENVRILRSQDSVYRRFLHVATAKVTAGESGKLERMNADRLYNENKIALEAAEHAYRAAHLELQRWMNTSERVEPAPDTLPVIAAPRREEFRAASTPLARVLEDEERASARNLGIARQGFLPDFTVALRRQFLLPGYNPYDIPRERFAKGNFTGFEVGISLPLFFGEQRARARAARRDLEITRVHRQETLSALATGYRIALDDHARARTALAYHLDHGRSGALEISRVARLAYEQGEIGHAEYIQNLEAAVDMLLQRAAAINDYNQSVIILNYLQGNL